MLCVSIWSGDGFSTNSVTSPLVARAHEPVGGRVLDRRQRERRRGAGPLVLRDLGGQVHVGQHVAVEHQEALVEQRLGVLERAAGAERPRLLDVAQPDAEGRAVAEHVAHAAGQVAARHDDVVDAVAAQPVEHEADERAVDERDHRLGHRAGQRPQARALAARQDQRLHHEPPLRDGPADALVGEPGRADRVGVEEVAAVDHEPAAHRAGDLARSRGRRTRATRSPARPRPRPATASARRRLEVDALDQLARLLLGDRVVGPHARAGGVQPRGQHERRRLAHVVGVRLEREPEQGDLLARPASRGACGACAITRRFWSSLTSMTEFRSWK